MVPQQQRRRRRRAALTRTSERRVVVARGAGGFGFTIAGQRPCVVSAVAAGGPAERAGLRAGDALIAVDGANVARAPHASVARLVAAAPGAIALSVAPREAPPTDTEDTEPDERARTRRRHPPPRRRPQPAMLHHPACHAAPSTSGVSEILHNLSRAQLTPGQAARLECRAVVGYLGTIETPSAAPSAAPGNVRTAVRKLRQERRPAILVLLSVLPNTLFLRRPGGQILAHYQRERILYAGCGSDADGRYFGLVTAAESENDAEASHSCHVFAVDPRNAEHEAHVARAREFQITCTRDAVAERCLEFPPSAEYVVGVVKGMYSLPADDFSSPNLQQISKLAVKGDSPAFGNFSRCNRAVFRVPRERRPCRHDDRLERLEAQEFVANSPQPSNHSEITTTSSNSDSGIGFHNDCRNIADRILVVDFAGPQPPVNRFRQEMPRRPLGLVGCGSFDADGSFLSNTTPVVDGFAGQGRPLNADDVLGANDLQPARPVPRTEEDNYNYNNAYGNVASSSRGFQNGVLYDQVYTESEGHHYEIPQFDMNIQLDRVVDTLNSVEIYEEKGESSKASADSVSVCSARSHEDARSQEEARSHEDARSYEEVRSQEEARPLRRRLQASLDDMLMLGGRDPPATKDEDHFVHPATVKSKVRKIKPLNLLSKTKHMLTGREREKKLDRERARALSASAGDVAAPPAPGDLPGAASEPDLRQSEQSSPFRRWTTGSGAGSSYRHHHDPRAMYNKQMSEGAAQVVAGSGGVARWSLGLEQLLADPAGAAAFAHFLSKEFAAENIRFWWSCEQYSSAAEAGRAALAQEIWSRHLAEGAPEPVNVDAAARRATALRMHHDPAPQDLFQQAQKQIFNVMKFDSYPRFLRSSVHAECARADLRGLPAPYAPRAQPDPATPTKLKKSASNASERRRSGGSILPWKLRAGSRDRASDQAPVTDLVKSSASGQCSLCRVVLPDGASSVVGVDAALSVRRLVERLLQRLNLPCPNYDVIVRDDQGECTTIDPSSPSTVLSGREATVERRCVVRVEVAGRVVAVRCRPQRRAAHVLRPVLRRYLPGAARCRLLRDAAPLPLDTPVQELDGARLIILEVPEGEEVEEVECELNADDELDSLSEMALRLHDDRDADAQSGTSSTSRSEAGRVRAALRPGPPLHHHPPDFLESLHAAQRMRLQGSGGGAGAGRSPPPLPPKPGQRAAPTLV